MNKTGEVYVTKDLKKFDLLVALPKDIAPTAVCAYGGQLYIGTKTGEVYRTKL